MPYESIGPSSDRLSIFRTSLGSINTVLGIRGHAPTARAWPRDLLEGQSEKPRDGDSRESNGKSANKPNFFWGGGGGGTLGFLDERVGHPPCLGQLRPVSFPESGQNFPLPGFPFLLVTYVGFDCRPQVYVLPCIVDYSPPFYFIFYNSLRSSTTKFVVKQPIDTTNRWVDE